LPFVFPSQVEKQIGERRKISFHGTGLSVAPEMNFNEIVAGSANLEEVTFKLVTQFHVQW